MKRRVAVVGGGAAGMMAAVCAAEAGASVFLYEQNEKLGKKLYITGKGRCNLANTLDTASFFSEVVRNPRFLYSAVYGFDSAAVCDFFESRGLKLKTERGGRIFPASDKSSDVIATLKKSLEAAGVKIILHTRLTDVSYEDGFVLETVSDGDSRKRACADALIVACGGLSYPATGSDGKSFSLLKSLGHSISGPLMPALVPMRIRESEECAYLMGLALKNVQLRMYKGKKKLYEGFGELLYTHFGLSGPLVLSASSYYPEAAGSGEVALSIDLKPAISEAELDERLVRELSENKNKEFGSIMRRLLPGKLAEIFPERLGIAKDKLCCNITKEERRWLLLSLKELRYSVEGLRGFEEAIITRGGVNVKEVNPSTMESKLVPGLYIAGEVLDVDALTGGFNLQIAWATGHLAGISAAKGEV